MNNKTLAVATITGVAIITIADAPTWRIEAYAGWLGAMAGSAFLATINAPLGNALAALLLTSLVLRKGEKALGVGLQVMNKGAGNKQFGRGGALTGSNVAGNSSGGGGGGAW